MKKDFDMLTTKSILLGVAITVSAYAVKNDPRIEYNRGGPDYAAVINTKALAGKNAQDNAAELYKQAFDLYKTAPSQVSRLQLWQGWPSELSDEQRTALDEWLTANQPAILKLTEGSRKSFFWLIYPKDIPLGTGPLSTYTQVNSLADALCRQAKIKAADGVIEDAIEDILTAYRFGQQIAAPPHTLAEQSTGLNIQMTTLWTAAQIINRTNPDATTLAELQNTLQTAYDRQKFYFDLAAARLWTNDAIDRAFTADGGVSKLHLDAMQRSLNLSPEDVGRWQSLSQSETESMAQELFAFLEPAVKKMPLELRRDGIDIEARIDQYIGGNVLLEHYRPDIRTNFSLPFRCRAQVEAVITICALKRYYAQRGTMPATLQTLVDSGYLKAVPLDPYHAGSLSYFDMPKDFKLYSWGEDSKDNFARPSKWGEGASGGDEVFWPIP
jgi:hypothetical protein